MTTLLTGGGTRHHELLDDDVDLARDRALVTRAQEGDRGAFDDLYVRYYRRLYRFCLRRLHDSYEAEDVAQEAFARAWRALPNFAGDRRFYPWLSVIAAHLCTDVLRRRNRSTPVAEFHQGNVASTEDGGEELMLAAVDSDLVARAFTRLSDRHQRILHLREGSGWSYQRIADHEGVGITAVETLLWRARQALKREFAALAGAEGRIAAWLGGLASLASLRRLLRLRGTGARRVLHLAHSGPAVAMGSAAAATAVVVAATLSGPMNGTQNHAQVPIASGLPGAGGIVPASSLAARPSATPASVGSGAAEASPAAGSASTVDAPVPGATVGSNHTLSGATTSVSGAAASLSGAAASIGGAGVAIGATVNSTVAGVTNGVSGTVQGVTNGVEDLLDPIGQLPLGTLGGTVSQLNGLVSGTSTAVSGLSATAVSGLSATVQNVTGDVAGALGSAATAVSGASSVLSGASSVLSGSSSAAGTTKTTAGCSVLGGLIEGVTSALTGMHGCAG